MVDSSATSLAESYTVWCDRVLSALADYAASSYSHHVHLQSFASSYLDGGGGYGDDGINILHVCLDVLRALGWIHDWGTNITFTVKQIEALRGIRARWDALADIKLNDRQRYLLEVVVRNSITFGEKSMGTDFVDLDAVTTDPDLISLFPTMTDDLAAEELDELVDRHLCEAHKTMDMTEYRATYERDDVDQQDPCFGRS
ncbi:MAG: hypothetical protein ACTHQE_08410 [Thermomicrobiales bacterium]